MDCERNICYAAESCETCEIFRREQDISAGKCVFNMEREINEILWRDTLGTFNMAEDGESFKNDTFEVKAYDWSDNDDNEYHFFHYASGLKIQWYKYPLRSPMCNMEISHEQFLEVLKDCFNSVSKRAKREISNKWWKGN